MPILWKGRGQLIVPFVVGGYFAAGLSTFSPTIGFWGAAAAGWLFALTLGKKTRSTFLEPTTGRPIVVEKNHTLFFLPPVVWAAALTGLALVFSFVKPLGGLRPSPDRAAAETAFRDAEYAIVSEGVMTGNSDEATQLAKSFTAICEQARAVMIETGIGEKIGLTHSHFSTYVHLTPTQCVILVQVPVLRKFSPDAKNAMAKICWQTAQSLASTLTPQPTTLAIGIRGSFFFDRAYRGRIVKAEELAKEGTVGIEVTAEGERSEELLIPLFSAQSSSPNKVEFQPLATAVAVPVDKSQSVVEKPPPPASVPAVKTTPALPTAIRDWKSADGRPLRAALVRFMDDQQASAEFRREDGQVFQVAVDKFSDEDQHYIHSLPVH